MRRGGASARQFAPSCNRLCSRAGCRLSDIQNVYPLIHNKVTSPHYVTPTLRRGRLLDWLHAMATCRAVVIAADAGYGKTTLLWQWEREVDFPCYWYKLDRNDRDWSLHISYLIESIKRTASRFRPPRTFDVGAAWWPGILATGRPAYLLADMYEKLTEPCTFIIDDWQFVSSVTEVRGLWNQILRDAPPTCRFVFSLTSQAPPAVRPLQDPRRLRRMRTDALRFTDHEIEELFRDIYDDPLDPAEHRRAGAAHRGLGSQPAARRGFAARTPLARGEAGLHPVHYCRE